MNQQKAFIFDMDGTMVDNMHYHLPAWEKLVKELGGNLQGEALMKELYGKNELVIERIFGAGKFAEEEAYKQGERKEELYRELYAAHLQEVNGLTSFLEQAKEWQIKIAMGTAATKANIDFVLDGLPLRKYFEVIVGRADVVNSKPDPETFLKAADLLQIHPAHCVVFEDVPKGVECAARAGMQCVVLTTTHQPHEFESFTNILQFVPDFSYLAAKDFL
jgi:beta-phosphoglucomutase